MKTKQLLALAGITLSAFLAASPAQAQGNGGFNQGGGGFGGGGGRGGFGGGNFDPAQFQQQMQEQAMANFRDMLEVKDDEEWKVIGGQVKKVMDAQTAVGLGSGANMLRAAFQRPRNNGGQDPTGQGGGARRMNVAGNILGGQPDPDMDALQKVIDAKGSNEALKAAMTKVIDGRKAKEAKLEEARMELRKLLTVRQEAIGLSLGLF